MPICEDFQTVSKNKQESALIPVEAWYRERDIAPTQHKFNNGKTGTSGREWRSPSPVEGFPSEQCNTSTHTHREDNNLSTTFELTADDLGIEMFSMEELKEICKQPPILENEEGMMTTMTTTTESGERQCNWHQMVLISAGRWLQGISYMRKWIYDDEEERCKVGQKVRSGFD